MTAKKNPYTDHLQQAEQNLYELTQAARIELDSVKCQGMHTPDYLRRQEQQQRLQKILELADNSLEHLQSIQRSAAEKNSS